MSQRLMLTALKSARLNGVPFGTEKKRLEGLGGGGKVAGEEKKRKTN